MHIVSGQPALTNHVLSRNPGTIPPSRALLLWRGMWSGVEPSWIFSERRFVLFLGALLFLASLNSRSFGVCVLCKQTTNTIAHFENHGKYVQELLKSIPDSLDSRYTLATIAYGNNASGVKQWESTNMLSILIANKFVRVSVSAFALNLFDFLLKCLSMHSELLGM